MYGCCCHSLMQTFTHFLIRQGILLHPHAAGPFSQQGSIDWSMGWGWGGHGPFTCSLVKAAVWLDTNSRVCEEKRDALYWCLQ